MKVDLSLGGGWDHLCRDAKALLGLESSKCQVKLYKGLSHALFEVTQGLALMFPHKLGVAHLKDVSPYYEPLMIAFSRNGYQIHSQSPAILSDPAQWLTEIQKDSVFLLWNDDDPITGRLYEAAQVEAQLKEKRIFRIRVSHSSHLRHLQVLEPHPYQVELLSVAPDLCLAVLGERARFVDSLAPSLHWTTSLVQAQLQQRSLLSEDADAVLNFEKQNALQLKPIFNNNEARLFDRAVVYWPDLDGQAVLEALSHKFSAALAEPGEDARFETTSLCRWDTLRGLQWFANQGWSAETIRGLLVLDHSLLTPSVLAHLAQIRSDLLKIQNG